MTKKEQDKMAEDMRNAGLVNNARPTEHAMAGVTRTAKPKAVARKRKPK